MSKKSFTNEEILSLSKNRYIKRVSENGITYTDEFKSLFIAEHRGYTKGFRSIKMLLEQEFNLNINRKCIQRIMRKYNIKCPISQSNPSS